MTVVGNCMTISEFRDMMFRIATGQTTPECLNLYIPCPSPPLTDQEIDNLYQDESLGDAF